MIVHPSARKHGICDADGIRAAYWAEWVEPLDDEDDWPHRQLRLGFDRHARLLETVVLVFNNGDEMLIHAMPARKQYRDLLP